MNAKNLLVAFVAVAAACSRDQGKTAKIDTGDAARAAAPASYVGSHYDPMPAGTEYESGSVILGKDGKPSAFVLSHVSTPKGLMIWLDEVLPDDGAIRRRVVRATMDDPAITPSQRRIIGTCGVYGRFAGDVVAVVADGPGPQYTTVHRAWRAVPEAARFDSISTQGVVCEDPEAATTPPKPATKPR